jgi:hypothetical protein
MNVEKHSKSNGCSVRDEKDRILRHYTKSTIYNRRLIYKHCQISLFLNKTFGIANSSVSFMKGVIFTNIKPGVLTLLAQAVCCNTGRCQMFLTTFGRRKLFPSLHEHPDMSENTDVFRYQENAARLSLTANGHRPSATARVQFCVLSVSVVLNTFAVY